MAVKKMTIRELRDSQNLTQKKLGEILGVNNITISNYENGRATPNDKVRDKIRELYGVEIIIPEKAGASSKPGRKPKAAPVFEPEIVEYDDDEWDEPEFLDDDEWETLEELDDDEEIINRSVEIVFQRPDGQIVELADTLDKLENLDRVYITISDPKLLWVSGDESGTANMW